MDSADALRDAIAKLQSKSDVITAQAKAKKAEFDQVKDQLYAGSVIDPDDDEARESLSEFSDSIRLLSGILQRTHLDEFLVLMANPGRLFTMHLFIGFFRGLGFAIGLTFIGLLLAFLALKSVHSGTLHALLNVLANLRQ
ncbi:MAG: hypothetical protein AAB066_00615 [Candidatus Margulisiibacteriota bacterium]